MYLCMYGMCGMYVCMYVWYVQYVCMYALYVNIYEIYFTGKYTKERVEERVPPPVPTSMIVSLAAKLLTRDMAIDGTIWLGTIASISLRDIMFTLEFQSFRAKESVTSCPH